MNIKSLLKKSLLGSTVAMLLIVPSAMADSNDEESSEERDKTRQELRQHFRESIDVDIEITDDGGVVTITTEDERVLERLQDEEHRPFHRRHHPRFKNADELDEEQQEQLRERMEKFQDSVDRSVTNLDNGIQITITTSSDEALEKVHNKLNKMLERQEA